MLKRKMSLSVAADDMALPPPAPRPYWHVLADMAYVLDQGAPIDLAYVTLERRRVATERALATAHLDTTRRGESITYTTPAPSYAVATVSDRKVSRGKKGTSTTITRRGRVLVVGDSQAMDDQTTRNDRVPRVVIAHAIDELRNGNRFGHVDGDKLAALTTRLFDLPELDGTDQWNWSKGTQEIPSSAEVIANAMHSCGLSGGAVPMLDMAIGPEYRTYDNDPRWFPAGYARKPHLRKKGTRVALAVPRRRKLDPVPRENVVMADRLTPWRTWYHVIELRAPRGDAATMWHGHRVVTRGETVKRARIVQPREMFVISRGSDLAHVLPNIAETVRDEGAARYAWRVNDSDVAGLLTIDSRKRVSITGLTAPIRQVATPDALRKRIALAI